MRGSGKVAREAGREAAAERLRRLHESTATDLLSYLARRTLSAEDAADLLAEAFLVAWRRIGQIPKENEASRMWMFVVARNVLTNWRRGTHRRIALADELRTSIRTAIVEPPDTDNEVRDAVNALPAKGRDLVMLVHWDGFTIVQAAQLLHISESTARGRYQRAKAALRIALEPATDDRLPALPKSMIGEQDVLTSRLTGIPRENVIESTAISVSIVDRTP
ncbi:MAG: RNA polymerase sigma factor [Ramlibacter sp.]|nr:RNA polymerase sigma factor [Cryobacterium sp.]